MAKPEKTPVVHEKNRVLHLKQVHEWNSAGETFDDERGFFFRGRDHSKGCWAILAEFLLNAIAFQNNDLKQ